MSEAEVQNGSDAVPEVEQGHSSNFIFEAEDRCQYYRIALGESLTPQLRCMIRLALGFYKEALEAPEIHKHHLLRELNRFHGVIEDHWGKVYSSFENRARLSIGMTAIQEIIASQLHHDYTGTPCEPNEPRWVRQRADKIKRSRALRGDNSSSKNYNHSEHQELFVEPLQELMFDREHVETRLIMAAEAFEQQDGRSTPIGYIQHLTNQRDWPSLAEGLWNDRFLTARLYRAEKDIGGSSDKCFNMETSNKILRGINKIKDKYFSDLSGPTTFTLSQHAKKMSVPPPGAEKAAPAERKTIGQHLESETQSAWASARSIAALVKVRLGEFRSRAHIAALGAAPGEEMNPLLEPKSEKSG
ncbi:hypothetical protein Daus18300_007552 [Diaporthe australafricana]|uniref:Uncharacterized protein n=1 Tax=Diaporthe australafricana TaxID=127596 RepID=A0ABR3WMU2_9PEZI